jgi:heme oxygenase
MDELRMLVRLNEETQPHHCEADANVDRFLFRDRVTSADYRTFLTHVYGFLVPVEASLAATSGFEGLFDIKARAKAALAMHDLLALGMTMTEVNELPHCQRIPVFRGPAAALGWLYAIERPLLSSAVIRGHLSTFLPFEMSAASAYLSCYSGQVGARWRELGEVMDTIAYTTSIADCIVVAAHDAFRTLHRWQSRDMASAIRYAG